MTSDEVKIVVEHMDAHHLETVGELAEVKADVTEIKADVADIKVDVADLKNASDWEADDSPC